MATTTTPSSSFVSQLCFGSIEEEQILPYPKMSFTEQETFKSIRSAIEQLMRPHEQDFRAWDAKGELPEAFLDDEFIKSLADHALDAERFIWDNVT